MAVKLFVGSLAYSVTQGQLEELFSQAGKVESCSLISDKFSGQSKGFAFVEMSNDAEAKEAISKFNNFEIDGRRIVVNVARPREDRGDRGFGGGNQRQGGFSRSKRW
ncbi:RNA-binding protein [Candidatus Curtissbacteria bacterium]|nr:RNA-binding protein [Candidatus Curtissbacteria bacterium]